MAKERSYDYFWNSDSDRYYDADSMGDWLRPFFRNGIFNGQMQVTANDNMSVTVAAGYGYINGKHRHFLTPTTLDLEIASGTLDRIDSVILRRNDTERRIHLVIEKGGNAKSPVAPALTREGAVYDLKLADIYIAAGTVKITQAEITDTRMNAAVCGWVAATVKEIDFTQIQAQFDAYFTAYKKNISDQYQDYIAAIQSFKDQAQEQYDLMVQAFNNWYLNNTGKWTNEFLNWFDGIKGILGTDPAGALQNEIETLQNIIYSGEVPADLVTADGDELVTTDGDQLIAFWTLKTSETCHC